MPHKEASLEALWLPLQDRDEGFEKGKLLFGMKDFKLHGRFTLVRTKRQGQKDSKECGCLCDHRSGHSRFERRYG